MYAVRTTYNALSQGFPQKQEMEGKGVGQM